MADIIDRRPGGGGAKGQYVRYHDEADESWSMAHAAHLRAWNSTSMQWERVAINDAGELITTAGAGGGGGGTQYTEGDTDDTITGNAILWEESADTLTTVSTVTPLPVILNTESTVIQGAPGADAWPVSLQDSDDNQIQWLNPDLGDEQAPNATMPSAALVWGYDEAMAGWDRIRGTAEFGLEVDVVRIPEIALDAPTLAALESVTVVDGGGSLTVDGPLTDAQLRATPVPAKEVRAATAALTTVADTASSTTILASNAARLKAIITNDSSARLYLRFEGAAASTSNYGVSLAQHETWEEKEYTGEIRGIWATDPGDGAARVTEFTA